MASGELVRMALGSAGLGVCVFAVCLVWLEKRCFADRGEEDDRAALWLSVFLCLLGYELFIGLADALGALQRAPWLHGLQVIHWPLLPVSLLLYVKSLTRSVADHPDRPVGAPRMWLAAIISWFLLAPALFLPAQGKQVLFADLPSDSIEETGQLVLLIASVGILGFWCVWIGSLIVSGLVMWRRLLVHDRWLRSTYSNLEGVSVSWVRWLLGLCAVAITITVVDQVMTAVGLPNMAETSVLIYVVALAISFGLLGIWQQRRSTLHPPVKAVETEPALEGESIQSETSRYARSALTDADCDRILAKLDRAMRDQSLWRNSDLKLPDLSEASGVKTNNISQALNMRAGRNFFDFVNHFRVEEACALLTSTQDSVVDIAIAVGFNAKSTFYTAFRKARGMTPAQYRADAEAEKTSAAIVTAPEDGEQPA